MLDRARGFLGLSAVLCAGCGAAYDVEEVNSVLFPDSGVVAGYEFGATWEDIKSDHNEAFEVRDDGFKQLRRKSLFHNAGDNGYFVGFGFDESNGVDSFDVSINGANPDTLKQVLQVHDQLRSKYEGEYGPGDCTGSGGDTISTRCSWSGDTMVELRMSKLEGTDRGGVDLTISTP